MARSEFRAPLFPIVFISCLEILILVGLYAGKVRHSASLQLVATVLFSLGLVIGAIGSRALLRRARQRRLHEGSDRSRTVLAYGGGLIGLCVSQAVLAPMFGGTLLLIYAQVALGLLLGGLAQSRVSG